MFKSITNTKPLPFLTKSLIRGKGVPFAFFVALGLVFSFNHLYGQTTQTYTSTSTFVPAAGVTSVSVSAWGGGGGGGSAITTTTAAGGGGGGGSYASGPVTVVAGTSYAVIVGGGGSGGAASTAGQGENGAASTFDASQVVAAGGTGGVATTSATPGAGGAGGTTASSTGTTKTAGGNGAAGIAASGGGGGGGSGGSTGAGGAGAAPTAGIAGTGGAGLTGAAGGAGGNGTTGSDGIAGTTPGGGGGGGRRGSAATDASGGAGAKGQVLVTYTCPAYALTSTTAPATGYSTGSGISITLAHTTTSNLPVGTYTVTYNMSGANTATGLTATMTVTGAGSGSFTTASFTNTGSTTVTVTNLSSGSPACSSNIAAGNTVSISSNDRIAVAANNWGVTSSWSDGAASPASVPNGNNKVTVSIGGTMLLEANQAAGALAGTGTIASTVASTFTIGALNLNTTYSGVIAKNTATINIVKTGTGTQTLSGSNTYDGTTDVNQGTLSLAHANALGSTSATAVANGATLNINNVTINKNISTRGNGVGSAGALTGTGTATLSGGLVLTTDTYVGATGTFTISGAITGSNGLTKVGSGNLILTNGGSVNTYSGGTTINAGTLTLGASEVMSTGGGFRFNGGTLSTGTTTGFTENLGQFILQENSNLKFGTGVHDLIFSSKGTLTAGKSLTITGWKGTLGGTGSEGRIFVGASASLTAAELGKITFFDGTNAYPAAQLPSGEIVAASSSCPKIPAAPSIPVCDSLAVIPPGGGVSNGIFHGVSSTGSCSTKSLTLTTDLVNGNASTRVYIKAGETLTIPGNINGSFTGMIFIMPGGTLNLSGAINGGTIYVYGTFNHAIGGTAANQGSPSKVYVASSGVYNAGTGGGFYQQNTSGTLVIEGVVNTSNFSQFQGNALTCLNTGGCFNMGTVTNFNAVQTANTGFIAGSNSGSIYYTPIGCPGGGNNATFSNSPLVKICAPNIPAGTTCPNFGSATVLYGAACNLAGGSNCAGVVALPVVLSYFDASLTGEGVLVTWGINDQWDSDYFLVEKSHNGIDWSYVGSVEAINARGTHHQYSLTDPNPYQGDNYYRLVEVNIHGEKKQYAIDYVNVDQNGPDMFTVFPNPTSGELNVRIMGEDVSYQFELIDILGRTLLSKQLNSGTTSLGDVVQAPGVYFARLKVYKEYKILKLVVR